MNDELATEIASARALIPSGGDPGNLAAAEGSTVAVFDALSATWGLDLEDPAMLHGLVIGLAMSFALLRRAPHTPLLPLVGTAVNLVSAADRLDALQRLS